jgi:putative ABC transport system permease protein
MKGQVFAITLVIISGVVTFILLLCMHSLDRTRTSFYWNYNFVDVFVNLKRAPENLKEKIKEVPGVNQVEIRVAADVKLGVSGFPEPVTARIKSTFPMMGSLC